MRLLIDHTTLHSLVRAEMRDYVDMSDVAAVLQLIEELLLADEVLISMTTERASIHRISSALIGALGVHDQPRPQNDALFTACSPSQAQTRQVLETAAAGLHEHLLRFGSDAARYAALRSRGAVDRDRVAPATTQLRNLPELLLRASTDRGVEDLLSEAFEVRDLAITTAPLLMDDWLRAWACRCASANPDEGDTLYDHLITLLRLYINRALASHASYSHPSPTGSAVLYAPAYARALTLARNYLRENHYRLHMLQEAQWSVFKRSVELYAAGPESQEYSIKLPILGAFVLLSMPKSLTIEALGAHLRRWRTHSQITELRAWLRKPSTDIALKTLQSSLAAEFKLPSEHRVSAFHTFQLLGIPSAGFHVERDLGPVGDADVRRLAQTMLERRPHVITSSLGHVIQDREAYTKLTGRVEALYRSTRQLQ